MMLLKDGARGAKERRERDIRKADAELEEFRRKLDEMAAPVTTPCIGGVTRRLPPFDPPIAHSSNESLNSTLV